MPIVSSGQLALSAIRDEFGAGTTSNVSLRTLSAAAGLSVPDGFNEFYGLSSYTAPTLAQFIDVSGSYSGAGTPSSPYYWSTGGLTTYKDYDSFYVYSYYCENNGFGNYISLHYTYAYIRFTVQTSGTQRVTIDLTTANSYGVGPLCVDYAGDTYSAASQYFMGASQSAYTYSNGGFIWSDPSPAALRNYGPVSAVFNANAGDNIYYYLNFSNQTVDDENWGISGLAGTVYFEKA